MRNILSGQLPFLLLTCVTMTMEQLIVTQYNQIHCDETDKVVACTGMTSIPYIPDDTEKLVLFDCAILTLKNDTFVNLPRNLTSLTLRNLNAPDHEGSVFILPRAFTGLENLKELVMSQMSLQLNTANEAFYPLWNLRMLNMSHNNLVNKDLLPILYNMSQLEMIDFSHNWITSLEPNIAPKLLQLRHLNLNGNQFESLEDMRQGVYMSTKLQSLDIGSAFNLQHQVIFTLNALRNFTQLETLVLNGNYLNDIENDFFENCSRSLSRIYFRGCYSLRIDTKVFEKISPIEVLDFSESLIPIELLFKALKNVNISDLILQNYHDNPPVDITLELMTLLQYTGVKKIDFSGGTINTIKQLAFSPLENLTELGLQSNSIHSIGKDAFKGLTKLKMLYLQNNHLSTLPEGIFSDLSSLVSLQINNNDLMGVDGNLFDHATSLEELDLSHNNIGEIPEKFFSQLINIKILSLRETLKSTTQVKWRDQLIGTRKLWKLDLRSNGITAFQVDSFYNLELLTDLDISGNRLETLPNGIFDTARFNLKSIYAQNNLISTLDVELFTKLNLTNLDISVNPFNCECNLAGLAEWISSMVNNSKIILNVPHTKCFTPKSLRNTPLFIYANQTASCHISHGNTLPVGYIVLFVTLIVVAMVTTGAIYVRCRKNRSLQKYDMELLMPMKKYNVNQMH